MIYGACTVTASFSNLYTLTISKSGTGKGTVASSGLPGAISCSENCSTAQASFYQDSSVTLAATGYSPSIFSGWSGGGCTGANGCVVFMDSDKAITASFNFPAPSGLTAAVVSATQINLTWTDNIANDLFVIERKTGSTGAYFPIAVVGANVTSYASKGLIQNTSYFYRVRAYYNGAGYSAYTYPLRNYSGNDLRKGTATSAWFGKRGPS